MHASIWKFTGDPDELTRGYDAMVAEFPTDQFIAHLCLRAPDGIVDRRHVPQPRGVRGILDQRGVPLCAPAPRAARPSELHDYPVHAAFLNGALAGGDRADARAPRIAATVSRAR